MNQKNKNFKYKELVDKFTREINSGILKHDDKMPSEPDISKRTGLSRNTIRQAMKELENNGYLYRVQGKGTFVVSRKNKSKKIALVLYDLNYSVHPFTGRMIEGIGEAIALKGYTLDIMATGTLEELEAEVMKDSRYAGFILGTRKISKEALAGMIGKNVPFVFAKNYLPGLKMNSGLADYKKAGKFAMSHIASLKHKKIALLNAGEIPISKDFTAGVLEIASSEGIEFNETNIFDIGFDLKKVDSIIDNLINFSAIITFDDDVAIEIVKRFSQKGISVPADISVIGCNDTVSASLFSPSITTVRIPIYELGKTAGEQIANIIEGNIMEENITLDPELIIRESTAINKSEK